jgi:peptidoglycan/xylan/chitin deacetylase (PgdA/CDA1 family)
VSERRLSVCLSFDFDAMSVWIASTDNPATISRGEFGAVAVPRILALLERRHVRATFFVPGHTALAYPELVREIDAAGHEIGHHGWVHENPAKQGSEGERAVFERGLEALDRVAGVRPTGYRSPAAEFSRDTIDVLLEYGMRYDSSCSGSDFTPYYLRQGDRWSKTEAYEFGEPADLVELPFSWLLDDFPHFEFEVGWSTDQSPPSTVREIWQGEFDYAYEQCPGGVFVLTMHPQVIGRGSRMAMLDDLIAHMAARDGVAFEPLVEHAERWRGENPHERWRASGAVQVGPPRDHGSPKP